jgi:hypothetical protein
VSRWESGNENYSYYGYVIALISYHPKCEIQQNELKLLVSKEARKEATE